VSPVGAKGLCQFMDGTWGDVSRKLGISAHPFDPKFSIQFASFYMAEMRSNWTSPRPEFDRHSLAMASYNAGFGNLLRAQRLCHGSIFYDSIVDCLPQVTGRHSKETTEYVNKIWVYYLKLWLL
jgi:membrane-bound lytic murein transglycosylase F